MVMPENSRPKFAMIRSSSGHHLFGPAGRNLGNEFGTFTRALRSSPDDSSRTVTAMLSERFEIIGKG